MYKELRKKAKKKVEAKLAFYICGIVFSFVTVVLVMLSFYIPSISFWLKLPIPIFVMVLSILYIVAFGLPFRGVSNENWQEEEIEKEMVRLYKKRKGLLPPSEDLSPEETLELREMERLEQKWGWDEDYV